MKLTSTTQTTIKTQGQIMKEITLTYPAVQVPTEADKRDVLENHSDCRTNTTAFSAFIAYAAESHEEYKNPTENLNTTLHMINMTPAIDDEMDRVLKTLNENAVQILQALAENYETYNDKEKSSFNIINRLESEIETRKFLQLSIDTANTSIDYFECATLANDIFGEEEVVFRLFASSIALLKKNIGTSDYYLNTYIERMNFSEQQKVELKTQLQNKVKSLN